MVSLVMELEFIEEKTNPQLIAQPQFHLQVQSGW